ncbi:MAG: hypothetical protein ACI383_13855 [Rummeliibacillus sp.]
MSRDKKTKENGLMAISFDDVENLGWQMEKRRSETELEEVGREQDPEQFDDNNK